MLPETLITQLKTVPITNYLGSLGHYPTKAQGSQLWYISPLKAEKTPSFTVGPELNVFHCFSTGERGDVITLVQLLHDLTFLQAVQTLQTFSENPTSTSPDKVFFSFNGKPSFESKGIEIRHTQTLKTKALLAYCQSRKIPFGLASQYLTETYFSVQGKPGQQYALSFKNDKGGLELRNQLFKSATAPKFFTTIEGQSRDVVNVFEGAFDFLSGCVHFKTDKPHNFTLVLNSLSLLPDALPVMKTFPAIRLFFDNDRAGFEAKEKVIQQCPEAKDASFIYKGYKDFNDFLVKK